jgi:fido (protein-threonine AMPylation protein)
MNLLESSGGPEKSRVSRPRQVRTDPGEIELGPRRLKSINATLLEGHVGAGAYRNTSLVNGASELASTPGWEVSRQEARIFTALKAEDYLRGLSKEQFITRLAVYRTAFIKWGPFHGANQRSADLFLEEVAQKAGYQVNMKAINHAQLKTATAWHLTRPSEPGSEGLLSTATRS